MKTTTAKKVRVPRVPVQVTAQPVPTLDRVARRGSTRIENDRPSGRFPRGSWGEER
jgi:hypothetical protein